MGEKERAVVYARVSTNQEHQKSSIKSQKEYYSQYAKEKGFELVNIYFDEGLTGTSSKRKYFLKMLHDAGLDMSEKKNSRLLEFDTSDREPLFDWIILKDVSRFARNTDAGIIAKLLRENGVYIIFENMGFTTKDSDWEFRFNLLLTFAQQESIDRSIKGKKAYQIKYSKGGFHMSKPLLGYKKNHDTEEYEIDEKEAEIVRYIFDLYVNHKLGTTAIADICNQKNFKTKTNKNFTPNTVIRIIKNEKYKGLVITNRETYTDITGTHKRVTLPESEWNYNHNAIPAIVSPELFDSAQKIRLDRVKNIKNNFPKGKKEPKSEFYMKLFCGKCHADLVRTSNKKVRDGETVTEYFYICRNRRYKTIADGKCDNKGVSHKVLVRELTKIGENLHRKFNTIRIHEEEQALKNILNKLDGKILNSDEEKAEIRSKIDQLDEQINNITNSIAGGVSESVHKVMFEKIDQIEAEKVALETSMLEYNTLEIENKKRYYIEKFKEIEKFSKKQTFSYDDVISLIHKIHILPHREALVELKTPTLLLDDEIHKDKTDYALLPFTFDLAGK
ncbi:recombinase family protein [Gracilibacillus saliphilus]|uniref:recombinase family protein n=1 Tax=Gracilibacillus saliphilus TaxID=543890 RepID=UPI0013D632BC|nr:recombinase family protein [Gracilibacillus saliphilus]